MVHPQFFLLLACFKFAHLASTSTQQEIQESPKEIYQRLFKPGYTRDLEKGDTRAAKKSIALDLDVSFLPIEYEMVKDRLEQVLDEEKLTEEVYRPRRFLTIEHVKKAYITRPEVLEKRQTRRNKIINDIKYYERQKTSSLRPVFNNMHYYLPSVAPYVDPLVGAPSTEDLKKELATIEAEMVQTEQFIDENPRWFLRKDYYKKDQFGVQRAVDIMAAHNSEGVAKQGDEQTILVMDEFTSAMPKRIKSKCVNYKDLLTITPRSDDKFHGVKVASVAVDSSIGIAPAAKFRVADIHKNQYFPDVYGPSKPLNPNSTGIFRFVGNNIERHHLHQFDQILQRNGFRINILDDAGMLYVLDLESMQVPEENVINMSFIYMDHIGSKRNSSKKDSFIGLVQFTLMVLKIAQAGKVMIWAAGNDSVNLGDSHGYSLMRSLGQFKPDCFISVLALEYDQTELSDFTNQPGNHFIQHCSISAPGTFVQVVGATEDVIHGSGTSFAAPFVSGAMSLLMSNFPEATALEVRDALLISASPVVIKRSESRYGNFPVVIRGTRNCLLTPKTHHDYLGKDGKRKKIFVTQEMMDRGREKYGVGIINISGAATYLMLKYDSPEVLQDLFMDGTVDDLLV